MIGGSFLSPRMNTSETWILRAVVLLLATALCSAQTGHSSAPAITAKNTSIEQRTKEIQAEVKRIDSASNASDSTLQRKTKELPHWQFSGVFENSAPIFLNAHLTEGEVVREESYYLADGKLILVSVEKWWDVEKPQQAPEPATREDFYCENGRVFRRANRVESRPPAKKIDDTAVSAEPLVERSRSILHVLQGEGQNRAVADQLRTFPHVGVPER